MKDELSSLAADVRENLLFLQELGVTGLETAFVAERRAGKMPKLVAANPAPVRKPDPEMERSGAEKPVVPPEKRAVTSVSLSQALEHSRLSGLKSASGIEKEPVASPAPSAVASESLFGDVAAVNELPLSNETLEQIRASAKDCRLCRLCEGRTQIVHSVGNPQADLMFIGEAPGADEDAKGEPFVGRAGQLLTKIIEAISLSREEVFIGNINRCRPPQNRQPQPDEATVCKPYLLREIAVVRPKIIVVLGATALHNLLETKAPISKIRGQFQDYYGVKVMPTFHPAYLLRDPRKKREVWEDMQKVRDTLAQMQKK
jgi:DNA polymerase